MKEENERASLKLNITKTKIIAPGPITSWQIDVEKVELVTDFLFLGFKITVDGDCSRKIRRYVLLVRKAVKSRIVKEVEWRIDTSQQWCWRRLMRVPWTARKLESVNLKGNQPWILIERTDAEVETPMFWSSDVNSWLTGKVPDAGKDWGQTKRRSEDEMAG